MPSTINIIMVEDHPEYREGIALALETEPKIQLTHQFGMAEQALRALEHDTNTDVVLLDLNLPEMSGLEAIPWMIKYRPDIKIIVLSQSDDESDILQAIHLGAAGYLLKESTLEQIINGIQTVVKGGASLDPRVAKFIINTVQKKIPAPNAKQLLSERELEILKLLSEGYMKKEISDHLKIETSTVATHVRRIYEKLQVPNAPAAITKAYRTGIFSSGD
ncbi:response regulator transcription factor [Coraliomargarita algicola]|uniref:Response regulator transcription factor n=1 Tax=Coraliomargarita algicola TaxID=3092156 RepID=A0ABZ0RKR1_9BACT|nr:response regulator transcription factor [Coraliomargarita sp. J2-16]WPJ95678.1 response regulator transcription factor [Coraliomargarita sp. J2-16]